MYVFKFIQNLLFKLFNSGIVLYLYIYKTYLSVTYSVSLGASLDIYISSFQNAVYSKNSPSITSSQNYLFFIISQ